MKADAVNAWFLRSRPSGETSLRINIFTREYGIIEALYKGGRSPKKKSSLQPFMPLWVALDVRHEWYYVRHLESELPALYLPGQALFAGLYLNEILDAMLKPLDDSPVLFDAYVDTLTGLSETEERRQIEPLLRRFERVMLDVAGYAVSYTHDARTGREIEAGLCYEFVPGVGFCVSQTGTSGRHILNFREGIFADVQTLDAVKGFMRRAIVHALDGKEIQTRKLYYSRGSR